MAARGPRRWIVTLGTVAAGLAGVALFHAYRAAEADRAASAVAVVGAARVTHILGPRDFESAGTAIGSDFGVTGKAAIVFSVDDALRVVDDIDSSPPRIRAIALAGSRPESFALDPDGTLLAVAGGYFGALDEDAHVVPAVPLPDLGMRLAPSVHKGAVYMFGGAQKDFRLYRFITDGTLQVLLDSQQPIVAAADNQRSVYAATASTIVRIEAVRPEILFRVPDGDFGGPIRSLAVTEDDLVIFSTDTMVYILLGPNALSIVNDAGGTLRLRDGALYVLDPRRRLLFSLRPASFELFAKTFR